MVNTSLGASALPVPEKRGKIRRFFSAVWRFVVTVAIALWHATLYTGRVMGNFAVRYVQAVNEYTRKPGPEAGKAWIQYAPIRYSLRALLWLFVPVVMSVVPIGIIVIVLALLIVFDQATWETFEVNDQFTAIVSENEGKPPTVNDIGITLMSASYYQMERELRSLTGWTVNDVLGLQTFDNKVNRQLGVRHASIELLSALSTAITKLGSADEENPLIVQARQSGFSFRPDSWIFPSSESQYRGGIELIKEYQDELRAHSSEATINITNTDIETILRIIDTRVLEVPHGRLNARNFETSWFELDDHVFYAQGAAIVARDALVAMRSAFSDKIALAGATVNMDRAVDALEAVVRFHPWVIARGDGDSMWADHRAKLSRYFTEARQRIRDVADAIQR